MTNPTETLVLPSLPEPVITALRDIVGPKGWIDSAAEMEPYLAEERGRFHGRCAAVVRPASVEEVSQVVQVCAMAGIPIVPQGGNTGLVGGAVPADGIILSTSRLNRIRALDPINRTITVDAGVILSEVQAAADAADALFPLSLAAEGSCQIGGNLATNAGGIAVLRYGNARDLVLGLEVVLPDGRVWEGLRGLRKDNTGYDLKQLFLGSEGTLGIITAAVLKLFPKPRVVETVFAALPSTEAVLELFHRTTGTMGDALTAFEFMQRICVDFCLRHIPGVSDPFGEVHPCYVLMRLSSPRADDPLRDAVEAMLADAFEAGIVTDAVVAANETQAQALWRLRESIPEAQKYEGGSVKHDVSVPVSAVAAFLEVATAACAELISDIRVCAFGHVGDGNIHFNLSQPIGMDKDAFLGHWEELERVVYDIAWEMNGSFSAEHGVGQLKRNALARYKSPVELALMRTIKAALDPHAIMNPGKIVDPA